MEQPLVPNWYLMAAIFLVTLAVSLALTPVVRRVALRRGLVDVPGEERRVHAVAVPRLGGLAMYAAFLVGVLLTFAFDIRRFQNPFTNEKYEASRVLLMLAGAGLITAVMAVDDIKGLKPLTKLIWQVAAALLVIVPSLIVPGVRTSPKLPVYTMTRGRGYLPPRYRTPSGTTGSRTVRFSFRWCWPCCSRWCG